VRHGNWKIFAWDCSRGQNDYDVFEGVVCRRRTKGVE
jgi:hypothetical protein